MKLNKLTFIFFLLLFILLNFSIVIGIDNANETINNYFRIHIVANSDDIGDQILKLTVSQKVNDYISTLTINVDDKTDYVRIVRENIYNILSIAKNVILENNYDYSVTGYIGKIKYDEKVKNNYVMEAGIYDSLKIVIGNGNGENWWSLLFPNSIDSYEINDAINSVDVKFESGILNIFNDLISIFKEKHISKQFRDMFCFNSKNIILIIFYYI